jgi:histidinol phosphatase-like PHP family hydrolase
LKITSDWHIHTANSCDDACLPVAVLIARAAELGIENFGITDHVHTPFNWPDIEASRREFLANSPSARFHFGIEVSCVSQWEIGEVATGRYKDPTYGVRQGGPPGAPLAIALTQEQIRTAGIEYVVGGTHWPMYVPYEREAIIREFHRQNMFLAAHPLVTIVAHPWWWHNYWQEPDGRYISEPWLDDFRKIPQSIHDEFTAAVLQFRKVVEINIEGMLFNAGYTDAFKRQYLDYLAGLKSRGVSLSMGSDCHNAHYNIGFEKVARMLDSIGITENDLWVLPPRR